MSAAITIDTGGDWFDALWISALVGALAASVAELLLSRGKAGDTGAFELPHRVDARWVDLGSFAAIPIGILAAVIAAFALTPVQEVVTAGATTRTMELDKLIVVAAIAGLASSSFLTLVQERFVAVARNQRLNAALSGALRSFDELAATAAGADAGLESMAGPPVAERALQAKAAAEAAAGDALER
jgi:hypothetical protein